MANGKPRALVTGASAGIGAAFARRLARDGYDLILVARRGDRLEQLAQEIGGAEVVVADLADDGGLHRVADRIAAELRLELLVNNAGFGAMGPFFEAPLERQERMHRLHVLATVVLTHAALRRMVARNKGAVINVSSVAGFALARGSVSYCATKAWLNVFTEGLHLELRGAGSAVRVQALCPGRTRTEFHEVAHVDLTAIPERSWMNPEDVVDASLEGLAQGKLFVVPGRISKTLVFAVESLPRWLYRAWSLRSAKATNRTAAR